MLCVGWLAVMVATPCAAQSPSSESSDEHPPLDDRQLLHKYVWSTLGPTGMLQATLTSGFEQWRDSPAAWPQNARGYADRWASEYAVSLIGSTTKYGVARLLHQDPSFARCECTGIGARFAHAITAPFKARTPDGQWVFSPATVTGITAENVIPATTWYPAPHGVHDGLAHVASGMLSKIAVDLVHEWWPRRGPFNRSSDTGDPRQR